MIRQLNSPLAAAIVFVAGCVFANHVFADEAGRIRPYEKNPRYWQYHGAPLLLLGGTKDDSLFQIPDLKQHLDELVGVGGNYIRNTMSDRKDHGFEVYAFRQLKNGKYDLEQWNDEYWRRFSNLLDWTQQRGVIVQIEVWDRFDYTDFRGAGHWRKHPYNPANNVNYTSEQSGLATQYSKQHPSRDRQPFFHSVAGSPHYQKKYDVIRKYQERFVAKLLSYSLAHDNVLYCMNNETSSSPLWGKYWIDFIRRRAREKNVSVYLTDMFDNGYKPEQSAKIRQALDDPQTYSFIDISQVNSRNFDQTHWEKLQWYRREIRKHPRPLNNTKIYGSGETSWGSGTPADGVERFWRNILAGCASARFHRDGAGNGLQPIAQASLQAARKVGSLVNWWDIQPRQDLLHDRAPDEAYLACRPGDAYVLYFTSGGSVGLDLTAHRQEFALRWINIGNGQWGPKRKASGGRVLRLAAPSKSPWAAVLVAEK